MTQRLVFVTSHPIQYQVPVFRRLAAMADIELTVLFAMLPDARRQAAGFGAAFHWDVPLLDGYPYRVLENTARKPGVTHFSGCDTPGVYRVLRQLEPDAVVVNGWVVKTCLQALIACRRLGIPCLVRGEANDLQPRPGWKRLLQQRLLRQYAACLYIGVANCAFYRHRGVPESRLFAAPYCVENERFEAQAAAAGPTRAALRSRWGIAEDRVCFLFCGKFQPKKRPLQLLEAFRAACTRQPGLHLLMVGDGELHGACRALAAQYELPVTFAGFLNQSQIAEAYVASDCLVLPSDAGETWGLVVNEAMACGRPALVSDRVGCADDLVRPGLTGEVFPAGDLQALADRLCGLGGDRERLMAMGEAARSHIRSYTPAAAAEGIREALRDLAANATAVATAGR